MSVKKVLSNGRKVLIEDIVDASNQPDFIVGLGDMWEEGDFNDSHYITVMSTFANDEDLLFAWFGEKNFGLCVKTSNLIGEPVASLFFEAMAEHGVFNLVGEDNNGDFLFELSEEEDDNEECDDCEEEPECRCAEIEELKKKHQFFDEQQEKAVILHSRGAYAEALAVLDTVVFESAAAQLMMGMMYINGDGDGVEVDKLKGLNYFKMASDQKFEPAMYHYAVELTCGEFGSPENAEESQDLMIEAAEMGYPDAIKFFEEANGKEFV